MSFPTTHWSLMAIASMNGGRAGRDALEELCRRYRGPVLAYFRSRLSDWSEAEDLTQELFFQLSKKGIWRHADSGRGRFRAYLLAIASHALSNWFRAAQCTKRGAGMTRECLDLLCEQGAEPSVPAEVASAFDREWAFAATAAALQRLEARASALPVDAARFAVLRRFLPGTAAAPSYSEAAEMLGVSQDHVRMLIHRMRSDFREALRTEVANTLGASEDLDEEMAHLRRVLGAGEKIE